MRFPVSTTITDASERRGFDDLLVGLALDGTDHPDHAAQGRMIRRYIAWRNRNADDHRLRRIIHRANVA